jgi:hypothetical protein
MKKLPLTILLLISTFVIAKAQFSFDSCLIAYYPFNGNVQDHGGNDYHGISTTNFYVNDRFGTSMSSFLFDGSTSFIELSTHLPDLNFSQPATVAVWVKTNNDSRNTILALQDPSFNAYFQRLYIGDNITQYLQNELVLFGRQNGASDYVVAGHETSNRAKLIDNNWHLVVYVFDGVNSTFYLDTNQLSKTVNHGSDQGKFGNLSFTTICTIGARYDGSMIPGAFFEGAMDDFRLYNCALNNSQIVELFSECRPTMDTSLISSCDKYISPSGKLFTASGTYLDTIPNSTGCDSLMTINLTILNSSSASISASACDAYSWLGNTLTSSGTYIDTLVNATGCDSVVTLNLNVTNVDTNVVLSVNSLTASSGASFYQWYNCDNLQIIPGANSAVFTPTQTGKYAVFLIQNGCVDSSGCHQVIITSNDALVSSNNNFSIYPNPTSDYFTIESRSEMEYSIELFTMDGKLLNNSKNLFTRRNNIFWSLAPGMYILKILRDDGYFEEHLLIKN